MGASGRSNRERPRTVRDRPKRAKTGFRERNRVKHALALLVVGAARLALGANSPPTFEIERPGVEGPHPRVRANVADGRVTLVVDRRADLARALVRLTSGTWPANVVVRFENFPALEGFTASNGKIRAEARLDFGEKRSREKTVPTYDATVPGDAQPIGTAKLAVARVGPHIEVTLPATLLPAGDAGLRLDWVDAYRGTNAVDRRTGFLPVGCASIRNRGGRNLEAASNGRKGIPSYGSRSNESREGRGGSSSSSAGRPENHQPQIT
jgi:hypothetical protein